MKHPRPAAFQDHTTNLIERPINIALQSIVQKSAADRVDILTAQEKQRSDLDLMDAHREIFMGPPLPRHLSKEIDRKGKGGSQSVETIKGGMSAVLSEIERPP